MVNENKLLDIKEKVELIYIIDSNDNIISVPSGAYYWTTKRGAKRAISYALSQQAKINGFPINNNLQNNVPYYDEYQKLYFFNMFGESFFGSESRQITRELFNRGYLRLRQISSEVICCDDGY